LRDSGKCIELDDHLQTIVKHFLHDSFPVNTVVQKIANAMTSSLLIQTKDGQQLVHRGKAPFVDIKVWSFATKKNIWKRCSATWFYHRRTGVVFSP
jgi:hypothetical protein